MEAMLFLRLLKDQSLLGAGVFVDPNASAGECYRTICTGELDLD